MSIPPDRHDPSAESDGNLNSESPGHSTNAFLQNIGQPMPHGRGVIPVLGAGTIVTALRRRQHLGGAHDYALHCPIFI